MVWFAQWRKKWRIITVTAGLAASLAISAGTVHEWSKYSQSKDGKTQIIQLEDDIRKYEKDIQRVHQEFVDAIKYKSLAEKLAKENKIEEAKKNYRDALFSYKSAETWMSNVKIESVGVKLQRIKSGLSSNKYFNPRSNEIIAVEGSLNADIKHFQTLRNDISKNIDEIERILGSGL